LDALSTEDEGRDAGQSTPDVSPTSSRPASPPPGVHLPVYAHMPGILNLEPVPSEQAVLEAAMHAGFNAGVWTAIAMMDQQPQHMPANPVTYQPQEAHMGQMPLFFEADTTPFALPRKHEQPRAVIGNSRPFVNTSSNSSDAGTVVSRASKAVGESKQPCRVIWCDHRAFKETSGARRAQLERVCGTIVKTHKTAENCIRFFRKKQHVQGRRPCVLLVSWGNAPALLSYLKSAPDFSAKVVVLCDDRSCRKNEGTDQLVAQFPFIEKIATTWEEAVESACNAVAASR